MSRKQSTNDIKSMSELQTVDSPLLTSAEPDHAERKKYNIISEELRKQIIQKLTVEKKSIKEVSKEFNLKLSTCKAILQVYLKEGRIGKKTTRDRKTKIVNTLLIASINHMNPLQSTLTPFVTVSENKCSQKNMDEKEMQEKLVAEALEKASKQFQGVFDVNNTESGNVQIPQDSLNMLQQSFMQTQMQALNQFLMVQNIEKQQKMSVEQPKSNKRSADFDVKEPEEEEIDNQIVESIQKKILSNEKNYLRKNSIIIQKQSADMTHL